MASAVRWRITAGSASVQFGPQCSASSSTCGTPSRVASLRAKVVFPAELVPTTFTRR
jgi:hypothetical protein